MNTFQVEREDVAGKLTAAGVPFVTLDPVAPLPCVLVDVPRDIVPVGIGGWTCELPVRVVAAPPGNVAAAAWLLDVLELVLRTYPTVRAGPDPITRNDRECPAYTATLYRSVPNPDC